MKLSTPPAIGLAAILLLGGCMETMPRPERPKPPRPRPEKPIACTREYAPVCAARGWQRKTFSNACMAKADGYRIISERPCGRDDQQARPRQRR